MSEDLEHEIFGGSSADIWSNCYGSYFLQIGMPPKVTTPSMELGTRVHAAGLEYYLKGYLEHKIKGTPWPLAAHVDTEVIEASLKIVDVVWEQVLFESITSKAYGIEEKYYLSKSLSMGGFIDLWVVYIDDKGKRVLVVFDYKNGRSVVPIKNNPQIAFYACCVLEALKKTGKTVDYVRGIIYQPNASDADEDPKTPYGYKETKFTPKQLEKFREKFLLAANEILIEKKSTFKVGSHCRWCRAQGKCEAYAKSYKKTTSLALLKTDPFEELPSPDVKGLTDEQLTTLVLNSDRIKKFLDEVKDYCIDRGLNKSPVAGLKCIAGRSQRKWKDGVDDSLLAEVANVTENPQVGIWNHKLKGILEIETLLSEAVGKKEAKVILEKYTEQSVPSTKLVSETDERTAIINSINLLKNTEVE